MLPEKLSLFAERRVLKITVTAAILAILASSVTLYDYFFGKEEGAISHIQAVTTLTGHNVKVDPLNNETYKITAPPNINNAEFDKIIDLLAYLKYPVSKFDFNKGKFDSLDPLARIKRPRILEELSIRYNRKIVDLSKLKRFTGLKKLYLDGTSIKKNGPLAYLHSLEKLDLSDTKVSDLGPITNLLLLKIISVDETLITDLSPIGTLVQLERINFSSTRIGSFFPLKKLSKLQRIDASCTKVTNLDSLSKLENLHHLHIGGTNIGNLAPVLHLKHLKKIYIGLNQISMEEEFRIENLFSRIDIKRKRYRCRLK